LLIAVIGNNWLTSADDQGNKRLDSPEDLVRMEIGSALKRKIRVIPVLMDGASMPRSTDLPEDLKPLIRRNALLVTQSSFDGDYRRLADAIRMVLEKAAAEEQERSEKERRQREEKERLEAEQRERDLLEADHRERRRLQAERLGREERQHQESERLASEKREKDRLEAEGLEAERRTKFEAEKRQRDSGTDAKIVRSNTQDRGPVQPETPPVAQNHRREAPKLFIRLGLLMARLKVQLTIFATVLIVMGVLISGLYLTQIGQKVALPVPASTPTASISPTSRDYNNRGWDLYQRGFLESQRGLLDEAISNYTEAIRLDPKNADAYYNRALAYQREGKSAQASDDFATAKQLGYAGTLP
jgi:tetratricopeptide (TPR) repeat protein